MRTKGREEARVTRTGRGGIAAPSPSILSSQETPRIGRRTALTLLSLAPLTAIAACGGKARVDSAAASPTGLIALGAWVAGGPWDSTHLDGFVQLVGVTPGVYTWYQDWVHGDFDPIPAENILARGATPVLTWMPEDYTLEGKPQPDYTLDAITSGAHDAFIRNFANNVAGWGKPLLLRFAHEMNDTYYPWAVGANGNKNKQYVPMWRHVRDIFNDVGVENVRWVWCPNVTFNGARAFDSLYPGDDYVDIIALDAYNFGTAQPWSKWASFSTIFRKSYDAIIDITDKPLMIGEMGCVEQGGDKAAWITQALLKDLPGRFSRVRAAVWFHENRAPAEGDWRVDTSTDSLAAFRDAVQSSHYGGRFP